jgi:PIN domain nuclease of toxin-antitoxin system
VRVLLDTHALLWWLDGDQRLPAAMRRLLGDTNTVVLVSAASAWEITTKARLGKLPGAQAVAADVTACVVSQGFAALPISLEHAARAGNLPGPHRDPFDRMLIAQSQLEGLPLVTNERAFDGYAIDRLWARAPKSTSNE